MGTGLDLVTFPGMGTLRGKYVSETTKIPTFILSNLKYFFFVSQPLIFLNCLSGRHAAKLQCEHGLLPSHSLVEGPKMKKYLGNYEK